MSTNQQQQQQQHAHGSGGGLFSKLRGQAEAYMAKVPAYNEMQHVVRQGMVQADPRQSPHTLKVQLTVKGAKGVIIDQEALARETKGFSKNILDLVREENKATGTSSADIEDVGDRIAFLTYKTAELHEEYAKKLEQARIHLKEIRNHENSLSPNRKRRAELEREIGKLRTNPKPDTHAQSKIQDLQDDLDELAGANSPLAAAEASALALRRQKLMESFRIQFSGLQELGEKLSIISGYGASLLDGWDVSASAGKTDYTDGERTALVRSGVESALAGWSKERAYVPKPDVKGSGNTTNSTYAPSFHESHANELAGIPTESDPFADHNETMESYYHQPESPISNAPSASVATGSGHTASAGSVAAPLPIPGSASHSGPAPGGVHFESPMVSQLNTAPVTSLPGVSSPELPGRSGATSGGGLEVSPSQGGPISGQAVAPPSHSALGMAGSPAPGLQSSSSASQLGQTSHAGGLPTVAETGAPITGTGGPSSGVLRPPSGSTSAGLSKEEEARQETARRFNQYSAEGGASGSGGADLDRDVSLRGRNAAGEQLPAYNPLGEQQGSDVPHRQA